MAGGEIGAGVELGRRQDAAVRPGMAVIFPPRQKQRPLAGRRAPGKRSIGTMRAAGVQMPSGAGQPSRHHGHVGKDGRRRRAGADPGIGQCRHVQFSPNASPAASRSPAPGFRPRPAGLFLRRRAGATRPGLIRGPAPGMGRPWTIGDSSGAAGSGCWRSCGCRPGSWRRRWCGSGRSTGCRRRPAWCRRCCR